MKKIISLLTIIFLTFILINGYSVLSSAMSSAKLTMTDTCGQIGEEISIDINLDKNPGIIAMRFNISWDDQLELVSVSNAQLLTGWTPPAPTVSSPYTLRWADSLSTSNNKKTGRIATLTFKIKESASVGNSDITLSFLESRNAKGEEIVFNNTTACIEIFCKHHHIPFPQPLNDAEHIYRCDNCKYTKVQSHEFENDSDAFCDCGYERVLPGDVNEDGNVTISDAVMLLRGLSGKLDLSAINQEAGNVAKEDSTLMITTADVIKILRFVLGEIKSFS